MKSLFAVATIIFSTLVTTAQPRIEWINTSDNFGVIHESNGKVALSFRGVNVGDEPLAILNAKSTCGCTTPDYPHQPVEPADTFVIKAAFDPAFQVGKISKKILITTNATPDRMTLSVTGHVIPKPSTLDARFPISVGHLRLEKAEVSTGKVRRGTTKLFSIDIYNDSDSAIAPTFSNNTKFASLSIAPKPLPPFEKGIITIYVSSDNDDCWGSATDYATLSTSPTDSLRIPIIADFVEDFSLLTDEQLANAPILRASTPVLALGKIDNLSKTKRADVKIENRGKSTLHIRKISASSPYISHGKLKKIKAGGSADLTVSVSPKIFSDGKSIVDETITIIGDDPASPEMTIRITAEK